MICFMKYATFLFIAALAAASAYGADDAAPDSMKVLKFCNERYALCIKAPCNRNKDGKGNVDCVCDVVEGWSMGPQSCEARKPVVENGRVHLISTYSNLYNHTNLTLSCPNKDTVWAICFGASCVVDSKDPKKAICSCPVKVSNMMTLGGDCKRAACKEVWSAATPAEDKFANDYFYKYMKEHGLKPPPLPPAKDCPAK